MLVYQLTWRGRLWFCLAARGEFVVKLDHELLLVVLSVYCDVLCGV